MNDEITSTPASGESEDWVTGTIGLNIAGAHVEFEMTIPAGPTKPRRMLPIFQSLAESFVRLGVSRAEAEGRKVSCAKGCAACCRHPVALSEIEAHHIREVLEKLPEPRRSEVRARFYAACEQLRAAGLAEKLEFPERFTLEEMQAFGADYLRQNIACPFLEDELCSIYADRPIACREYLVTSPAENCFHPTADTVDCVELPPKVSIALCRLTEDSTKRFLPWVFLILAPMWAEAHAEEMPPRNGPELIREVFERLTNKRNET